MRLALFRREPAAWYRGVERPDVEVLNSLAAQPGLAVVGQAADGADAVRLAGHLQPDVILMDVRMPAMEGLQATRQILRAAAGPARPRVLILTTFDLDDYVYEALRAGASGFLLKDATAAELVHAVRV